MSYQFEDESALEELLNQQLDRRKHQTSARSASRPGTSAGTKQASSFRPSTAIQSSTTRRAQRYDDDEDDDLGAGLAQATEGDSRPKNKLSAWLESGGAASKQLAPTDEHQSLPAAGRGTAKFQQIDSQRGRESAPLDIRNELPAPGPPGLYDELSNVLTAGQLQEMSKQRLIQLILERVVPTLENLSRVASKQSAVQNEQLLRDLQAERNRLQMIEIRHEEQLKLEQRKWMQINGQLESRLEMSERELAKAMESQREHLAKMDEQYKKNLESLRDNYERRQRDEQLRFEEILKRRDEMHRLETDSKLNVNCNLVKLNTIQEEWKRTLAGTITQLEGHFKSVESLLDKQTLQVNGTNSDLASKTKQLCDQYDKFEKCNQLVASVAAQVRELLPELAQSQQAGNLLQDKTSKVLEAIDEKLELLSGREKVLEEIRAKLDATQSRLNEDKLQLALDSSRIQMKEERLDELLKSNSECEVKLTNERRALLEQQTQAQTTRVSLEEKAADLKEQNYTLHLLRKRLTAQREELIKAQTEFAEKRKSLGSDKLQIGDESKRLGTLRVRVQRELDQLRRLQRSLVCSLCMGRLFGGSPGGVAQYEPQQFHPLGFDDSLPAHSVDGQLLGKLAEQGGPDENEEVDFQQQPQRGTFAKNAKRLQQKTMPSVRGVRRLPMAAANVAAAAAGGAHNENDLDFELRQTELESGQIAAESRYVEQLLMAGQS